LIAGLKAGDQDATAEIWNRYVEDLVRLARAKLRATHRNSGVEDEEDAALSAFESLCAGIAQGRFPRLDNRHDLWQVLVVITARKVLDQLRRQSRLKRGGGKVVTEGALTGPDGHGPLTLEQIVGSTPSPEFAAMVAEEFRRLLDALKDETLRQIALWRMEGYTNEEIAARLGCVSRTIERKLCLIRRAWLGDVP
jgi:RNA polymerase sigma factor (sigma-70 family)